MRDRRTLRTVVTLVAVLGAVEFIWLQLQPSLLLRDTTASGGDMGAHVWLPAYVRDHLLPHGRITGWTPDWYAGFPALHFYFPLPTLLIVLADVFLPYGIAFKLVTVLGLLTLPVVAYVFGRMLDLRFPAPPLLAVATLPFVFDRFHSIYGGNMAATLAGEFSFSIALSSGLLFLGVVARGLENGRHRALAAVLLAVTILSHLLPALFVLAGAAVLLALRADRHRLRWVLTSLPVAGLLAGFWAFPFVARMSYTNDMGWEKKTAYVKNLFPFLSPCSAGKCDADEFYIQQTGHLRYVFLLAATGVVVSVVRRQRAGIFLTVMALLSAFVFVVAPPARLWNARALPFWFLCVYLLAALGVAELARLLAAKLAKLRSVPGPERELTWPALAAPMVALAVVLVLVGHPLGALPRWVPFDTEDQSFLDDWARWNYSGYEEKPAYPEFKALVTTMGRLGRERGCGRAMWEYSPDLDRYGTPMAPMLLPYWTGGCIGSMEGLFFESAATTPYHFLNQVELSKTPSASMRDLPYGTLDVAKGVRHLQLLGVRYYLASSPEAKTQAAAVADLSPLATSGPWSIYEVADSALVSPAPFRPAVLDGVGRGTGAWLEVAVNLYKEPSRLDVPLAASGPKDWPRVKVTKVEPKADANGIIRVGSGVQVAQPPKRAVPPVTVSRIRTGDDRISFDVDRPGTPVLVKASYFPNWHASGARGPWRIAPNLMLVIPTDTHVSLRYGWTPVDVLGWLMTFAGVAMVVVLVRRRPLAYPQPPLDDEQLRFDFEPLPVADGNGGGNGSPRRRPSVRPPWVTVPDRDEGDLAPSAPSSSPPHGGDGAGGDRSPP